MDTELSILIATLIAIATLFVINKLINAYEPKCYRNIVDAREEWRSLFPFSQPRACMVSIDGKAALLELSNSKSVGLLKAVGTHSAAFEITPSNLSGLSLQEVPFNGYYRLKLQLNDPAFPKASILFPSATVAQDWLKRLSALSPVSYAP